MRSDMLCVPFVISLKDLSKRSVEQSFDYKFEAETTYDFYSQREQAGESSIWNKIDMNTRKNEKLVSDCVISELLKIFKFHH